MRIFVVPVVAPVIALCAVSQAALAVGTVEASRVGYGLTQNICVTGSQVGGTFTFPVGQFVYNFRNGVDEGALLNGDTITFCTDLAQDVFPGYALYNVLPLSSAPDPGPVMGGAKAQAIADVWAAAAGQQFTNAAYAAAFQMLVWDIAYDYTGSVASVDVATGNVQYQVTQSTVGHFASTVAIFDTLKAAIGSNAPLGVLRAVTNGDNQDQLVFIPAPGAVGLFGAAGLMVARRRRR